MTALDTRLQDTFERHQAGALDEAERGYRAVIHDDPANPIARNLLGVLCSQTDRPDEAIEHLAAAVEAQPGNASTHYNLGNALRSAGRLDDAVAAYVAALKVRSDHASANFNLGATLLELGRTDEAVPAFRATTEADPDHVRGHHYLALLLLGRGEFADAERHWAQALQHEPDSAEYQLNRGIALQGCGRLEEAITQYRSVTRLEPRLPAGWCNLGAALVDSSRYAEAEIALEHATELDPSLLVAHLSLARARRATGELDRAASACRAALQLEADHPVAHRLAAEVHTAAGDFEIAETHLRRAISLDADGAAVLNGQLGDLLRFQDRLADADAAYGAALTADVSSLGAIAGRIHLRLRAGDTDAAARLADEMLAAHDDHLPTVIAAAAAFVASGRANDAVTHLERSLEADGLPPHAQRLLTFRLAESLDAAGEAERAWETAQRANAMRPAPVDPAIVATHVDAYTSQFPASPADTTRDGDPSSVRPIFVVGTPLSGHDEVGRLIARREGVTGLRELAFVSRLLDRLGGTGAVADPASAVATLDPDARRRLADWAAGELVRLAGDRPVIVDTTPPDQCCLTLLVQLFPSACFVRCRRDPIETCLAQWFTDFGPDIALAGNPETLGVVHSLHEKLLDHWQATLEAPFTTVDTGRLPADASAQLDETVTACDLGAEAPDAPPPVPIRMAPTDRGARYERWIGPLREALGSSPQAEASP
ncbi:MAG: tetratricopeptide repeat protein [Planctomycetes bacterium]|nr:tetratricopeptide repeat protein [Planctomycetota bacterium]